MAYTPNLIGKFPQGSLTAGNEIEAGLPNITGYTFADNYAIGLTGGAMYFKYIGHNNLDGGPSNAGGLVMFDASRCSSVYRNDITTVQPPAITVLYYIRAK